VIPVFDAREVPVDARLGTKIASRMACDSPKSGYHTSHFPFNARAHHKAVENFKNR